MNLKETLKLEAINRTKGRYVKRRKPKAITYEEMIERERKCEYSRNLCNGYGGQLGQGFNQS